MYVCMYVCMYMFMFIYVYIYTLISMYGYIPYAVCVYIYFTHIHAYINNILVGTRPPHSTTHLPRIHVCFLVGLLESLKLDDDVVL